MDSHIYELKGHQLLFDSCHYRPAHRSYNLNEIAYIYRLEKPKLQFNLCCSQPAYKDFRAGVDDYYTPAS